MLRTVEERDIENLGLDDSIHLWFNQDRDLGLSALLINLLTKSINLFV